MADVEPAVGARVLADLTSRVIATRDDLLHSPIAYYFDPRDARHALPVLIPKLSEVVTDCSGKGRAPALRFQAVMLQQSVDHPLETIAEEFVGVSAEDPGEALAGDRRDHLWAAAP